MRGFYSLLFQFAFLTCCFSQYGSLKGTITERSTFENMPYVVVHLYKDSALKPLYSIPSDTNGTYKFIRLPPGNYHVGFECIGFKTKTVHGVKIIADRTSYVNTEMWNDEWRDTCYYQIKGKIYGELMNYPEIGWVLEFKTKQVFGENGYQVLTHKTNDKKYIKTVEFEKILRFERGREEGISPASSVVEIEFLNNRIKLMKFVVDKSKSFAIIRFVDRERRRRCLLDKKLVIGINGKRIKIKTDRIVTRRFYKNDED